MSPTPASSYDVTILEYSPIFRHVAQKAGSDEAQQGSTTPLYVIVLTNKGGSGTVAGLLAALPLRFILARSTSAIPYIS
jgi:hypothetical protein